jgi:hypothetical protein
MLGVVSEDFHEAPGFEEAKFVQVAGDVREEGDCANSAVEVAEPQLERKYVEAFAPLVTTWARTS